MADPELLAILAQQKAARAAGGPQSAADQPIIPLWKTRPTKFSENVNPGQFGDDIRTADGGRVTGGRKRIEFPQDYRTQVNASSSFLEMSEQDRNEFMQLALQAGLINPSSNGVSQSDVFQAWDRATKFAADFNSDKSKDKYISPWEATRKLALGMKAANGGAYDAFRPRKQTQTTARNFTTGQDAQAVSSALESLFSQEMGRAPTQQERLTYQKLVQKAYDMNPETSTSVTTTDPNGDSTTNTTQSGGVDMTATLLDQVRSDPESQAFQAGSTFFQAAMNALGAIA